MATSLKTIPMEQIPTSKLERWKYTNLSRALKDKSLNATTLGWNTDQPAIAALDIPAQYMDTDLWTLNAANTQDVRVITEDTDIVLDAADGQWLSPHLIIKIADGARVTVTERHGGQGAYWKNQAIDIVVGKNATLHHYRVLDESEQGTHTSFTNVKIAEGATYQGFYFIHGRGFIRNQIHAQILGANAHCGLAGMNLLSGDQHGDTTITIEHMAPHATSNQTFKSILADKSRGVFQGKVHVHQIAQKTDGYQLSNALILSPQAEMDTKPELEIYADDVRCSHGATTGKLDDAPLFYMRARGIPEREARGLLIEAFCAQAFDTIGDVNESFAEEMRGLLHAWLSKTL